MALKIASFFSGAGGLDLGFHEAGFKILWANEFDKKITPTLRHNFPKTEVDDRSITEVAASDIPDVDGIIGGPPCQSWSEAGAGRGLSDKRGQVFLDYIRLMKEKQPQFFLAENVSGMLGSNHRDAFNFLVSEMENSDYKFSFKLMNASDYGVPQDRKRVIFVGYHKDLGREFNFPTPFKDKVTLKDAIWDLRNSAVPWGEGKVAKIPNHEYLVGGFSSIYMSRNRVRKWDEQSFTIQAGARHAPLHPQAPIMPKVGEDRRIFEPGKEHLYRRFSVREAARIQTFPDTFEFLYDNIWDGYKMVGNAVATEFAHAIAKVIMKDLKKN